MTTVKHPVFLEVLLGMYVMSALVRADCTLTSTSGQCATEPKKISEWFDVLAQSNEEAKVSFVSEMEEGCNELPLKVEVQAKRSTGSEFIFPGTGITESTDKSDSPYGGVIYKYKADGSIRIMVPKQDTGKPSGVSLFSGGPAWEGVTHVNESAARVRYRAWCRCNLPLPGYESPWTDINVSDKTFLEIRHGLGITPDMVIVQLRHGNRQEDWISDVTGSMSSSRSESEKSGLIYGYDSNTIRIWAPNNGNLFKLADGWGRASDNDLVTAGQVKVYVWDYLTNVKSKSVKIDQTRGSSSLELALPDHVSLDQDIVYFTVSPTDGDNRGFSFLGSGSVQNADSSTQYGGLVHAYSADNFRIWHPKLDGRHFLVYINSGWGGANHTQSSVSVVAKLSVWKAGQVCLIPENLRTTPASTVRYTSARRVTTDRSAGLGGAVSPSRGNSSAEHKDNQDSWYDRSLQVPVRWLLLGGSFLFLIILLSIIAVFCLCKDSPETKQAKVSPARNDVV